MAVQYDHIVQHMMVKFFKYPMITYLLMTNNNDSLSETLLRLYTLLSTLSRDFKRKLSQFKYKTFYFSLKLKK